MSQSSDGGAKVDVVGPDRPKLMIVEDEFIIALALRKQVESLGYLVCCVTDTAEAAIDGVAASEVGVVLMDVSLRGEVDGVTAAGHITKEFGIPVVIVSAYTDSHTLARAGEAGAVAVLSKPAGDHELREVLHKLLGDPNLGAR